MHEFLGSVSRTPVPQPLAYLVADINRYVDEPIEMSPEIGELQFSGLVYESQVKTFLQDLEIIFPVKVTRTAQNHMASKIDNSQVQFSFTWANPAGAAVFRRGDAIWVVLKVAQHLRNVNHPGTELLMILGRNPEEFCGDDTGERIGEISEQIHLSVGNNLVNEIVCHGLDGRA